MALEQEVEEAVMESTAQYWKPVWEALETVLETATPEDGKGQDGSRDVASGQAQSNRGPRGRKKDFAMPNVWSAAGGSGIDSELCGPDAEQRLWRTVDAEKVPN